MFIRLSKKTCAALGLAMVIVSMVQYCRAVERNSNHSDLSNEFGAYYTRLSFEDKHTGKYADIAVRLDKLGGEVIFSRESSYLPLWKTKNGSWYFNEIIPRKGDGDGIRPDALNKYSYARVIENNKKRVVIHWRYMPDLNKVEPNDVVHEYFTITPSGQVTRSIQKGTERFDDWIDPMNTAVQELEMQADGIKEKSFSPANPQHLPGKPLKGNKAKRKVVGKPLIWWKFDEGLIERPYEHEFETRESMAGNICKIAGSKAMWKAGVSGSALAFDGYYSKVSLPALQSPQVQTGLTLEAWVAVGAYPFNDAAVIQQSNQKDAGYYLGVTAYGNFTFKLSLDSKLYELTLNDKITHNRWTHVTGTYDKAGAVMRLFVDGHEKASLSVPAGDITRNSSDVVIGLNSAKNKATDLVREKNNIPQLFGIEGLIDEVRVYGYALNTAEVAESYKAFFPGEKAVNNPDLEQRILPGETGKSSKFGAYYTNLPYHDLWDSLWRSDKYADLVVKFDKMPTSVVFWRGTCYGPCWVSENNKWMSDQSAEIGGPYGCAEHMSDKQVRHTYVRLVENSDARVVIHWRYSCADIGYNFANDQAWTDEYHTIYPDGVILRKVECHFGKPGWHEPQLLSQAGSGPLDNISIKAMSIANLKGDTETLDWTKGPAAPTLKDSAIELYNIKSKYKVFGIFPQNTRLTTTGWFN
ncbi:MAG: LamG domain-containing protein, partial [Candidatus Brocadiia bacterium]